MVDFCVNSLTTFAAVIHNSSIYVTGTGTSDLAFFSDYSRFSPQALALVLLAPLEESGAAAGRDAGPGKLPLPSLPRLHH